MSITETVQAVPEVKIKPIRGLLKVELFDAETGELVQKSETENLVTNAIQTAIQAYAAVNEMGQFMPLATVGLGGIMLFDDTLDADADNILFPAEAHLTGFGMQSASTDNTMMGSKNIPESVIQRGDGGRARTVWDFGTSQANGVIKSVALTRNQSPFRPGNIEEVAYPKRYSGGSGNAISGSAVLAYEDGYVYYVRNVSVDWTSSQEVYAYTCRMDIYKEYVPMGDYKVGDVASSDQNCPDEFHQSVTFHFSHNDYISIDPGEYICVDYSDEDGSAYFVWTPGNSSGNGKIFVTKFTRDGLQWSADDTEVITCTGATFLVNTFVTYGLSVKGFYILPSNDRRSYYKISKENPQDIRQATLPEGWKIYSDNGYLAQTRGGAVIFTVYTDRIVGALTKRAYRRAILYPDGVIRIDGVDSNSSSSNLYTYISYALENGFAFANDGSNYVSGKFLGNYLGTIANLPAPIQKNASQTLKITYTLVDA